MRILFLSTWFPFPPDNGAKLRVYHLLRALGRDHEVTLVSFSFGTARPQEPESLVGLCTAIHTVPLDPFEVNRAGALRTFASLRPMASRPIAEMRALAAEVLNSTWFDVVIASTEVAAPYALMAPGDIPKILEDHNSMSRRSRERYANATGPLRRLRCWASWQKCKRHEARLYPHFDLVTMVSDVDREAAIQAVGRSWPHVEVVPNGVDCDHNRPGLADVRPNTLIYNGALTYSANYGAMRWFLADIYPRVRAELPNVSLSITGSQKGVDLTGLALDDSVNLTGYVQDIRLPVAQSTLCVAPIRQGGGTRLKILEAMALGTPVVATSKGAEGLNAMDGEHLLLADTPEAFAQSVCKLLRDPAERIRLANNARRLVVTHYDWEPIGARFVTLVEATANRHRDKGSGPLRY